MVMTRQNHKNDCFILDTLENLVPQERLVRKDNYTLRKETIERTLANCKEQHTLRYTRVHELVKNEHNSTIIFACHNLRKW